MFTPAKQLIMMGRWFKNAIGNGKFNDVTGWNANNGSLTAANNIGKLTGGATAENSYLFYRPFGTTAINNKKIYMRATARVTNSVCLKIMLIGTLEGVGDTILAQVDNPVQNTWYGLSGIHNVASTGVNRLMIRQVYADAATDNGKIIEVKDAIAYDVTSHPAAEQTKEWCDANIAPFIIW